MKKISAIICVLILYLMSGISYAQIEELEGFRGLKWGMDISKLPESEFIKTKSDSDKVYYARKNEDLTFIGLKVQKIEYVFENNIFYRVWVIFDLDLKDKVEAAFKEKYYKIEGSRCQRVSQKGVSLATDVCAIGEDVKKTLFFQQTDINNRVLNISFVNRGSK
jgi:hypothetical protein